MIERETAIFATAAAVALACSLATESAERTAVTALARAQVNEVAVLAGLRDQEGRARSSGPLAVEVVQQGGPAWVQPAVAESLEEDDALAPTGGPHLLVVEVVHETSAWALRVQLHRAGWSLSAPRPARIHVAPWVAVSTAVGGAAIARRTGRWLVGVLAAAVSAQLVAALLPWPAGLPAVGWREAWRDGPLVHGVLEWARALPDASTPWLAGIAVLCAMLAFFDHRRTRSRGLGVVGLGILAIAGALAWLEAGMRTAFTAWSGGVPGILGTLALVCAWWLSFRRAGAVRKS